MNPELLEILACPVCEGRPALRLDGEFLVCTVCEGKYPIVDDIPQLLPESRIPKENA